MEIIIFIIIIIIIIIIISSSSSSSSSSRARGGAVGCGTALQSGRSRVQFPMLSLQFFNDIILPAALWH